MTVLAESWSERLRARWRSPRTLTALIPVGNTAMDEVNDRLARLAPEFEDVLRSVGDLHSFRLAAVPPEMPGQPVRVLLNSVHDLPLDMHLSALVAAAGPVLAKALEGAPFSGVDDLPMLLVACREPENTFHLGAINKTVPDVLAEARLLEAMETFADERLAAGAWNFDTPAEQVRREIRAHTLAQPTEAELPAGPAPRLSKGARLLRFLDLLATFAFPAIGVLAEHIAAAIRRIRSPATRFFARAGYALWWIYGALFTGGAFLVVRLLEKTEPDIVAPPPDPEKVDRLEAVEDLRLKNAVTLWFPVRDTFVRRALLRVILWGSERGCRHFWTRGALAGIDTIHYARILQVERGRTMIFLSDYDGSLDRYLMDFLGVGSGAVIPISSNVAGCPRTRWLFGQEDSNEFGPRWRSLIRTHQLETPVWYSAYPGLSVRDILSNAALREGLFAGEMSEEEAGRWAAML